MAEITELNFYVCPYCLSDKLSLESEKINCQDCHQTYIWSKNRVPHFRVDERAEKSKLKDHQPAKNESDLTLDIGAGNLQEGKINIDLRSLPGIDVVCNGLYLPFRDGTFSKVTHNQVIEHVIYAEAKQLLEEIHRVLKPGGILEFWTPNFQALGVFQAWLKAPIDTVNHPRLPLAYCTLSGVQDYPENVHISLWTRKLIKLYTEEVGFKMIKNISEQEYSAKFRIMKFISLLMPNRRGQLHYVGKKPE